MKCTELIRNDVVTTTHLQIYLHITTLFDWATQGVQIHQL